MNWCSVVPPAPDGPAGAASPSPASITSTAGGWRSRREQTYSGLTAPSGTTVSSFTPPMRAAAAPLPCAGRLQLAVPRRKEPRTDQPGLAPTMNIVAIDRSSDSASVPPPGDNPPPPIRRLRSGNETTLDTLATSALRALEASAHCARIGSRYDHRTTGFQVARRSVLIASRGGWTARHAANAPPIARAPESSAHLPGIHPAVGRAPPDSPLAP